MSKRPSDTQMHKERRGRNRTVLLLLIGFAALVYAISIVRMGGGH
ncbi:hypothetical protein [Radicibacter daui]